MRPSSLQSTNYPKGMGQGRSGKRGRQKEAYSRASSNFDAYGLSDLEGIGTDSEEEGTSDQDSGWESEYSSGFGSDDDEEDDIECSSCSRIAEAMRNWTGDEGRGRRVGAFGEFQRSQQWCDTCRQFVEYFTKRFQSREGGSASLRHFTPVFLARGTDTWFFTVGKVRAKHLHCY